MQCILVPVFFLWAVVCTCSRGGVVAKRERASLPFKCKDRALKRALKPLLKAKVMFVPLMRDQTRVAQLRKQVGERLCHNRLALARAQDAQLQSMTRFRGLRDDTIEVDLFSMNCDAGFFMDLCSAFCCDPQNSDHGICGKALKCY